MRKVIAVLIFIAFMLPSPMLAAANNELTVTVDGKLVSFPDTRPFIKERRTFIPLRGLFEALGATVNWDEKTRTITSVKTAEKEEMDTTMKIGSPFLRKEYVTDTEQINRYVKMDIAPFIERRRTMIPLRVAAEAFGYKVGWDANTRTVQLKRGETLLTDNGTFEEYNFVPYDKYNLKEKELEVFFLTNKERENEGKNALSLNVYLSYVASLKSEDMYAKQYFDHASPTFGSPFAMMDDFEITYKMAGENIAAGYKSSENVVDAWMNSEGHRENIVKDGFTEIGIGVIEKVGQYDTYWTQLFRTPF
jgi:uncharacterized YkwD family protein